MDTRIALFQKKEIRKTIHESEWWFVVVDVVAALSDSANPGATSRICASAMSRWPTLSKEGGKLPLPLRWSFPPPASKTSAKEGGAVSGNARRELEKKSGRRVVSRENYLATPESAKRLTREKRK